MALLGGALLEEFPRDIKSLFHIKLEHQSRDLLDTKQSSNYSIHMHDDPRFLFWYHSTDLSSICELLLHGND